MLIPEAAEKISGNFFLIYKAIAALGLTSRLLISGVNLVTFHKRNLDIYSEGNSFIKKQETTAELINGQADPTGPWDVLVQKNVTSQTGGSNWPP